MEIQIHKNMWLFVCFGVFFCWSDSCLKENCLFNCLMTKYIATVCHGLMLEDSLGFVFFVVHFWFCFFIFGLCWCFLGLVFVSLPCSWPPPQPVVLSTPAYICFISHAPHVFPANHSQPTLMSPHLFPLPLLILLVVLFVLFSGLTCVWKCDTHGWKRNMNDSLQ